MALPPGKQRLPKGAVSQLAEDFGVGKKSVSYLWGEVSSKLATGTQLSPLSHKKRPGRASFSTPTKKAFIIFIFARNSRKRFQVHYYYVYQLAVG